MAKRDYYQKSPQEDDDYYSPRDIDYSPLYGNNSRDPTRERHDRFHNNQDLAPIQRSSNSDRQRNNHEGHHSKHRHNKHRRDSYQLPQHDHDKVAQGAIFGVGAAELIHHHRKKKGEDVSHGLGHIARTVGAGVLGAVALHELSEHQRARSTR